MKTIKLNCESAKYDIVIGRNLLTRIGRLMPKKPRGTKVLVVSNRRIAKYHLSKVRTSLRKAGYQVHDYLTPYGSEKDKSEKVLSKLWAVMGKIPLERGSVVVALGGGVIGDLAGFAAATYMRGISVVQVPTTLLAQVDSSIGGKTAIDLPVAKNIIGAFHQPEKVIIDVLTLKSLVKTSVGKKHLRDSFAEVIKYGIISDGQLFQLLEKKGAKQFGSLMKGKFGASEIAFLENVIWRSAKVKAKVVSEDEYERKGKRVMLNLGHTFGHGFEAASNFRLSHGAAVSIGTSCAARMAVKKNILKRYQEIRILRLIRSFKLPDTLKGQKVDLKKALIAMQRDKKKKAGRLRFVLPTRVGKTVVRDDVNSNLLRTSILESGLS